MYGNPEDDFEDEPTPQEFLKGFVTDFENGFTVKDSGSKSQYEDGMQRDSTDGKPRFDLMFPRDTPYEEQLLTRVAMQYERGGEKYGPRNWEKSSSEESLAHHEAALMRHVVKFLTGTEDGEDHAAAIVWNVNAVDLTRRKIKQKATGSPSGGTVFSTGWADGEFHRYNPSTGQYEVTQVGDHEPHYWPKQFEEEKSAEERFEVKNGMARLDPLMFTDLVFQDGDTVLDDMEDMWYYRASRGVWTCGYDDPNDRNNGLYTREMPSAWGPLKITSGDQVGRTVDKDGEVRR